MEDVIMKCDSRCFVSSLLIDDHPMIHVKFKLKALYYSVLEYIVGQLDQSEETMQRLDQYKTQLLKNKAYKYNPKIDADNAIMSLIGSHALKWRKKYSYMLLCDIALICLDKKMTIQASRYFKRHLKENECKKIDDFLNGLIVNRKLGTEYYFLKNLPEQYYRNIEFLEEPEIKIVVTANMSAGKSTLINALTGKNMAKTAQEACTGALCYYLNKPFEDGRIHIHSGHASLDVSEDYIRSMGWQNEIFVASFFRSLDSKIRRIRIIDTPGVNSAVNRPHGEITKKMLMTEQYDKVVYILNANKLGTDEEISYLRWLRKNISPEKTVFVVNKLDDFKQADDNIKDSIVGVKSDLARLGYENPIICPLSAYFGYLLKRKYYKDELTEDEEDEHMLFCRKFKREMYDLSVYYDGVSMDPADNIFTEMEKRCGLYGLEKILFGGN